MIKVKKYEINNNKLDMNGWAGRLVSSGTLSLRSTARLCSQNNTVTLADSLAVMEALFTECENALKQGYSVSLGDLGSLNLTIQGTSTANPDDWDVRKNLNGVYVRYTPSVQFKNDIAIGVKGVNISIVD